MPALSPEQLRESETITRELAELNALLDRAGTLADTLTNRGYDVMMSLWHDTQGGSTVRGRLQGNVARASLRATEKKS